MAMRTISRLTGTALLALALLAPSIGPASALDLNDRFERDRILRRDPSQDRTTVENRLMRERFRVEQERNRDDDRIRIAPVAPDVRVPSVRRLCRTPIDGNSYLTRCR